MFIKIWQLIILYIDRMDWRAGHLTTTEGTGDGAFANENCRQGRAFEKIFKCSSSNLYFARVIPSIQTVLLSIGALEFKNLQYTFKNLLQPIYKMQGTFTNI